MVPAVTEPRRPRRPTPGRPAGPVVNTMAGAPNRVASSNARRSRNAPRRSRWRCPDRSTGATRRRSRPRSCALPRRSCGCRAPRRATTSSASDWFHVEIPLTHTRGCTFISPFIPSEPEISSGYDLSQTTRVSKSCRAASSVERQHGAREPLALPRRQVHGGVGHVIGVAEPDQVHGLAASALLVGDVGVTSLVEHVAGADDVAAHVMRGLVDRDAPAECFEAALGGGVGREAA